MKSLLVACEWARIVRTEEKGRRWFHTFLIDQGRTPLPPAIYKLNLREKEEIFQINDIWLVDPPAETKYNPPLVLIVDISKDGSLIDVVQLHTDPGPASRQEMVIPPTHSPDLDYLAVEPLARYYVKPEQLAGWVARLDKTVGEEVQKRLKNPLAPLPSWSPLRTPIRATDDPRLNFRELEMKVVRDYQAKGNVSNLAQMREQIAAKYPYQLRYEQSGQPAEAILHFAEADDWAFDHAADKEKTKEGNKRIISALAYVFDETNHYFEPVELKLSVRIDNIGGHYRFSGTVEAEPDKFPPDTLWLKPSCGWKTDEGQYYQGTVKSFKSMTITAEINLPKEVCSLPGRPSFRFICQRRDKNA